MTLLTWLPSYVWTLLEGVMSFLVIKTDNFIVNRQHYVHFLLVAYSRREHTFRTCHEILCKKLPGFMVNQRLLVDPPQFPKIFGAPKIFGTPKVFGLMNILRFINLGTKKSNCSSVQFFPWNCFKILGSLILI